MMHKSVPGLLPRVLCPIHKRLILSSACDQLQEAWLKERNAIVATHQKHSAKEETHKSYDSVEFLSKLSRQIKAHTDVSAYDLDIAVHGVDDVEQLKSLTELVYRFRRSTANTRSLDSTPDALLRLAITYKKPEFIAQLITDPLNYGIFPGSSSITTFIDYCLKHDKLTESCQSAVYLMRQEADEDALSLYVSVVACSRWSTKHWDQDGWEAKVDDQEEGDDKEQIQEDQEVVFRVPWLKNPWFDDHFDLESPRAAVGKTLYWAGTHLAFSDELKSSGFLNASLLGACLWGRSRLAHEVIDEMAELGNVKVLKTVVDQCLQVIELQQQLATEAANAEPDEDAMQVLPTFKHDLPDSWTTVKDSLSKLATVDGELSTLLETDFKSVQSKLEAAHIKRSNQLFEEWRKQRLADRDMSEEEHAILDQLTDISTERDNLHRRKELLSFFDHREEYEKLADLTVEEVSFRKDSDEQVLSDEEYAKVLSEQFRRQMSTANPQKQSSVKQNRS